MCKVGVRGFYEDQSDDSEDETGGQRDSMVVLSLLSFLKERKIG
jgi:hypothetical protein